MARSLAWSRRLEFLMNSYEFFGGFFVFISRVMELIGTLLSLLVDV